MKYKYLILAIILIVFISQATAISALTEKSNEDITQRINNEIDSIKDTLMGNKDSPNVTEVKVHSYKELKDTIEKYNSNNNNESYLITLEDGNYNITEAILYRSNDNSKCINSRKHSSN